MSANKMFQFLLDIKNIALGRIIIVIVIVLPNLSDQPGSTVPGGVRQAVLWLCNCQLTCVSQSTIVLCI